MGPELSLILGMAVVTATARLLPLLLGRHLAPPRRLRQWLDAVPYAALGSLIVPGILTADSAHATSGAAAALAAIALAMRCPAYVAALGAVAAAAAVQTLS